LVDAESMGNHALRYAKRGWPVFPLQPRGKKPLTPHGVLEATTNATLIERWWDRWPTANVGIATGEKAGFWVLDIDGPEGTVSLTELECEFGCLPETLEQQTGGGGRHLFFAWPPGSREIRNRQAIRKGIDVRGNGGYIVAPPSIHANGREYQWSCSDRGKVSPGPQEWTDLVAPVKRPIAPWEAASEAPTHAPMPMRNIETPVIHRAQQYLAECDPAVQGNGGHSALLWAARSLVVGFDLPDSVALDLLWSEFNPRCVPSWDASNAADLRDFERKVSEARRTPGAKPSGWLLDELGLRDGKKALEQIARGQLSAASLLAEHAKKCVESPSQILLRRDDSEKMEAPGPGDREPFRLDLLPGPLADYARQVAFSHGVDESFVGLPMLAVAGAAMGNAWRLRCVKRTFIVPPILWVALVSYSGSNKSGPLLEVVKPLKTAIPPHEISNPMLSPQGRAYVQDATIEAVIQRLRASHRGLLCYRDELAGWVGGFNAYKQSGPDEQAWIEFWGGNGYTLDRKTNDEQIHIPAASVAVLGGIQPAIMAKIFSPEKFASGLVPRMLISAPPERCSWWNDADIELDREEDWSSAIKWLRTRDFLGMDTQSGHVRFIPRILELTEEAKVSYAAFFNAIELQRFTATEPNCKSLISKIRGQAARMALIHHGLTLAAEKSENLEAPVGLASMEAGIAWGYWCLAEQLRVYGFGAMKYQEDETKYLGDLIRNKSENLEASARQMMRWHAGRWPRAADAQATMEMLVSRGAAKWKDAKQRKIVLLEGRG